MKVASARSMHQSSVYKDHWTIFPEAPESFEAAIISSEHFPVGADKFRHLQSFLAEWMGQLAIRHQLTATAWVQMTNLHQGDAAQQLSKNGALWMPELGLGVWPDREPPRLWTQADFHELSLGQAPPALMHTVFHLSKGDQAAKDAWERLAGSGTLIYALLSGNPQEFHQKMGDVLMPLIREEALRGYPFYMPLLDGNSLQAACAVHPGPRQKAPASQIATPLDIWMGPAKFYLRESSEDKGMLIVTSLPGAFDALCDWMAKPFERDGHLA